MHDHDRITIGTMRNSKDVGFNERRSSSAEAKQAQLAKFKTKVTAEDPDAAKRRAEREALVLARDARLAEREQARQAELARKAEEKARIKAEREAAAEAKLVEAEQAKLAAADLLAKQKAARDARYAARKQRR